MERWQWQVVEAVYAAEQGQKAEAMAKLHRMEFLFRKTGHVAAEITATGYRGLVQAIIARNMTEMLAARQVLMRSVYLAQEQKQQAEEVAAAVADKCALKLSRVVAGKHPEEAVGWYRLQRAPEMTVPRFRLQLVMNVLHIDKVTDGRELGFRIHEAHLQVREAAREAMMMGSSMRDNEPHLVRDILHAYERLAAAVVETQELSRAVEMLREALALGSSSSSAGLLSIGDGLKWQQWARTREEDIWYRMGRLLFKLRPGDDANLALAAEALAMFANSLQCALQDDRWPDECVVFPGPEGTSFFAQLSHDEKCMLTRANACNWAAPLIDQILTGTCPPEQLAQLCVLTEVAARPISRSQAMARLVFAEVALIRFPQWQGVMMGHIDTVLMHLVAPESSGSSNRSGGADASNSLLFGCTHTQPRCRILLSEDEMLEKGLFQLLGAMVRSSEEAADAEELGAAVDWYHKAAEVALVLPPGRKTGPLTHLSYRIGVLQFQAGALQESLEMLSNSLRHVLSAITVTTLDSNSASSTANDGTGARACLGKVAHDHEPIIRLAGHVPAVCRLVEQVLTDGSGNMPLLGDGWDPLDAITGTSVSVPKAQITLGWALCELWKLEGIRWLEAAYTSRGAAAATGSISGDVEDSSFYLLQEYLAWAYSRVAQDSIKAAQLYELCRHMARRLDIRLAMQLCAADEWAHAGELLSAEEAVLEALEYLFPEPASASTSNSELGIMSILRGGSAAAAAAAGSSWEVPVPAAVQLLACAATLPQSLWQRERMHPKLKATLEALWELCRLAANDLDYLKEERVMQGLLLLVNVYQTDEDWVAAAELLEALAPQLKDLYHQETPMWREFTYRNALGLSHSRHHLLAARVLNDLSSALVDEDASVSDSNADIAMIYDLLLSSALSYRRAGQHLLAEKLLKRLEQVIQAKKSWPPPGPDSDGVGLKEHFEYEICLAQAMLAEDTRRFDQAVIGYHKAASLQKAIIRDIHQRKQQVPDAKSQHVRRLVTTLTMDAHLHAQLHQDDVNGLEARIVRIEELDRASAELGLLQARLLLQKGDHVGAMERMREEFMRIAEQQERRGGDDDDSWITHYYRNGNHGTSLSLGRLVDLLENFHLDLQQPERALLWAERGRMRLFMHRVHADDPEPAVDSTHNYDFDRDDGKALDMLLKVLLACGPNVALLEYSFSVVVDSRGRLLRVLRIYCLYRDPVAGDPYGISCYVREVLDCEGIEQLVNKARNSIIVTPAADKKQRLALAKLHSLLVAPVQHRLHRCDTLIVVPDGCLSLVPFAALYDEGAGQFLIQQKQVVVAPCLRALYRCLDLQDRFSSTASTLQQPFVAGDPRPMGLGMAQLLHAQEEAAAVASILGVKPCLGAAMTREAVAEGLCGSSVVLLSTHATAKSPFPAGALVLQGPTTVTGAGVHMASTTAASSYDPVLWTEMTDRGSDQGDAPVMMRGFMGDMASVTEKSQVLTAKELSGMRIRAGLVVLSACETGRGEVTPEGVLGLGRALLQAGAATTVLSLWKVDDEGTKNLITEMFQELHNGELVGTALRKSMLKMIQEGRSINHWAPFFILGSPTVDLRNVITLKGKQRKGRSSEVELGPTSWLVLKNKTMKITHRSLVAEMKTTMRTN